jgi:putative drug exporter of the RND superfamily
MVTLTRWVLAHRRLVVIAWLVITIAGGAASGVVTKHLSSEFGVPGREGFETNALILARLGTGGEGYPLVPVVTLPAGRTVDSPGVRAQLGRAFAAIAASTGGAVRYASFATTRDRAFVSADGRTTYALIYTRPDLSSFAGNARAIDGAKAAAARERVAGAPVHLTGVDALNSAGGAGGGPGVLIETVIGGAGALVILVFVFGSFLAIVPLLMAIVSILTTFLLVLAMTAITQVSFIVEFLVALIGLGVAIDYTLLIVVRWREQRARGSSSEDAVVEAMATAGRAVLFSGTTVAVGLLALVVLPVPFLRSVGYGGMLIPLVSVAVAVTLLPLVLATIGPRLDWPRIRREGRASAGWTRWAKGVVAHRGLAAAAGLAIVVALLVAATSIQPGTSRADALSKSGDARTGLTALERSGVGAGALAPLEVVTDRSSARMLAARLAAVEGVYGATAPAGAAWHAGNLAVVDVMARADPSTSSGRDTLTRVQAAAHGAAPKGRVGGQPAQSADFVSAVYGSFPLMIAIIAVLTFVLLARAFRSIVLPLKAVALNVLSVGAAWGVLTLVWQDGHGSHAIFGIASTGAVTAWVPLMVFAFLFGLSMDYEVFILARMREEFDATGSTDDAVVRGIGRTGRLVTCAALILFLAFTSMASAPDTDVKVLATGLAAGILLDATVIRALLVPSLVSLLGRWNWWLPALPARLLRVPPSPTGRERART